nr:xylulose kinase-1 [Tanacetum cinerariifolium]
MIKVLPPKTTEVVVAREREIKARKTLLMALPEHHLAKFHKMADAKEMWEAIKSRFGGNDESKKMQKYLLKQQFEGFSVSSSKSLHKGYDRRSIKFRGGLLGIKCTRHSHCQVKSSHWQYKFPLSVKVVATARRLEMPLPEVCTAIEEKKKKLTVKDRWQLH